MAPRIDNELFAARTPHDINEITTPDAFDLSHIAELRTSLMQHPQLLTYLCFLPEQNIDQLFPGIFSGAYIHIPEPYSDNSISLHQAIERIPMTQYGNTYRELRMPPASLETQNVLKYFGAADSENLLSRTRTIVQGFYKRFDRPDLGELVVSGLDSIVQLHAGGKRKTGEYNYCHEARGLLGFLLESVYIYQYGAARDGKDSFQPLFKTLLDQLAIQHLAFTWHDALEDYLNTKGSKLKIDQNKAVFQKIKRGRKKEFEKTFTFQDKQSAHEFFHFLVAYTNEKYRFRGISANIKETDLNAQRLLKEILERRGIASWGLATGKSRDRKDNLDSLGSHTISAVLAKYYETFHSYRDHAIFSWNYHKVKTPTAIDITLLKLLGTTEDALYQWITRDTDIQTRFKELEHEEKDPLIVPSHDQAVIFTNKGEAYGFDRRWVTSPPEQSG